MNKTKPMTRNEALGWAIGAVDQVREELAKGGTDTQIAAWRVAVEVGKLYVEIARELPR